MTEFHDHKIVNPLTRESAMEKLKALTFKQVRDIATADALPIHNDVNQQIEIVLLHWFPSHAEGPISMPEMLDLAEKMPPGKRPVWRKRTHGKEMGF